MDKATVRKHLRIYRANVPPEDWSNWSEAIQRNTLQLISTLNYDDVMTYMESSSSREVSTARIRTALLDKGQRVYVPVSDHQGGMKPAHITKGTVFAGNQWGIPEPVYPDYVEASRISLVLVPLLGADLYGHRIGYGKGYYDRFLAMNRHVVTIGLCPESCLVQSLPAEMHDVALNFIVTETRTLRIPVELQ